ncbi:MAG: biopolymer transporter ExbD [Planctomycetes bacterium]|nr:biopolymer transporter ExbD [Planctomycetota bacterium]
MRLSSGRKTEEANLDMTPMIDIVFLLIIFFVTVSELSKAQNLKLELPVADTANPDIRVKADRLVINMTKNGTVHVLGLDPMKVHDPKLKQILHMEAKQSMEKGTGMAARQVVLRGDKRVEFRYVQGLMKDCQEAKIWQLELQADLPAQVRPDM